MTGSRGLLFDEGPTACPFIALDRDRERRADEPDSRHRCYATPNPEPRALAHQRNYCLTANFSACPIFQDWAIRAAARPVPLRPIPPALALAAQEARPVGEAELTAGDDQVAAAPGAPQQQGLFDEPPSRSSALPAAPPMPTFRLTAPGDDEQSTGGPSIVPAPAPAMIPPPERRAPPPTTVPTAARPIVSSVPALSVPTQPRPTPSKPIKAKPTLRREDIVPSWERARYDIPEPPRQARRRGGLASWLTLLFVALAVLALAAVVVLIGPVLLHSGAPTTPRPTPVAGGSPTLSASPATPSPAPQSSWQTYTIKLGDSLYAIAAKFGITYDQLLAANPQITNPNYILAGQVINIPPPDFVVPSPSGAVGSGALPSASH